MPAILRANRSIGILDFPPRRPALHVARLVSRMECVSGRWPAGSRTFARILRIVGCLVAALPTATHGAEKPADKAGIEFFEQRIRPVLVAHCYECHSAKSKIV